MAPPIKKPLSAKKAPPGKVKAELTPAQKQRRAEMQAALARFESGQSTLSKALGFTTRDARRFVAVAHDMYQANDFKAASDAAFVALSIDDSLADAWLLMGLSLAQRRRSAAARQALEQVLSLEPKRVDVWVHLAEVELADMKPQAAAAALKIAISLDPQARTPHGLRAQILVVEALSSDE